MNGVIDGIAASTFFDSRIGLIVVNALFAGVIGLIGLALYQARTKAASWTARRITIGLVVAAMLFSVTVVTWDWIAGTATSTESLIIVFVSLPLWIAIEIVVFIDGLLRYMHQRQR